MKVPVTFGPGIAPDNAPSLDPRPRDVSNCRYHNGQWQPIGGWESFLSGQALSGVCRNVFAWTDNTGSAGLTVAFGTHSNLYAWSGGQLGDITPAGLAAGLRDGAGGNGYGTGAFGVGNFGVASVGDYFPRTWSLAKFGQELIASPRGGGIYRWSNVLGTPAAIIANAPAQCALVGVSVQRQVLAFGCNRESDNVYTPLHIRGSDISDPTTWATSSANSCFSVTLEGGEGGRIVGFRFMAYGLLVWTDEGLFLGQWRGDPGQIWRFDRIGEKCGLAGPNAHAALGQVVGWVGADLQFWRYELGGEPTPVPSTVQRDFAENLAPAQWDKITCSTVSEFGEIRIDYPDARDGLECSRWIGVNFGGDGSPKWYRGLQARSAFCDKQPALAPIGVTPAGVVYYHERGHSADGGAWSGFIESGEVSLDTLGDPSGRLMEVCGVWPELLGQIGAVQLSAVARKYQQATTERTRGPYALAPGQSKKDFRVQGRVARLRLAFAGSNNFFRVGTQQIEVIEAGDA